MVAFIQRFRHFAYSMKELIMCRRNLHRKLLYDKGVAKIEETLELTTIIHNFRNIELLTSTLLSKH